MSYYRHSCCRARCGAHASSRQRSCQTWHQQPHHSRVLATQATAPHGIAQRDRASTHALRAAVLVLLLVAAVPHAAAAQRSLQGRRAATAHRRPTLRGAAAPRRLPAPACSSAAPPPHRGSLDEAVHVMGHAERHVRRAPVVALGDVLRLPTGRGRFYTQSGCKLRHAGVTHVIHGMPREQGWVVQRRVRRLHL